MKSNAFFSLVKWHTIIYQIQMNGFYNELELYTNLEPE